MLRRLARTVISCTFARFYTKSEMNDLTEGKERSLLLRFTIPMLIGNIFQQLYNVVDSIVIGRFLGNEALAAVGASFPLIFTLISFIIGISTGSTVIISQYFGSRQTTQVKRAIDTLYIVLFVASLLLSFVGNLASPLIFRMIDLPNEVIPQAVSYFNIYALGFVFYFGFQGTTSILRGIGDSKTPLYFLVTATLVNVVLDLVFVVVFHWGIEGVALATIIAQAGAFLTMVWYLNNKNELLVFRPLKMVFDRKIFVRSLQIGLPTGLQQTFVAVGMLALYKVVNAFGTATIAAYAIAMRIDSFASLPAMNFSAALSSFVGQNIGAGKTERIARGVKASLQMTAVVSVGVSIIAFLFPETLLGAFTDDQTVIAAGKTYLYVVSGFYIIFSTMFVYNGMLRGAGDTLIPMFVTLFSLWIIRIPVSWWLSSFMGPAGIWWGIPIAWSFGAFFSYIYYKTGRWKKMRVI